MRKLSIFISFMLLLGVFSFATVTPSDVILVSNSSNPGLSLESMLTGGLAIYETVVRIVPTVKDWSFISKILGWLQKLSKVLNVLK